MQETINKIENLLGQAHAYFTSHDEESLRAPIAEGKWSRKQIIGHLIDSALNNLQRFTEIGYHPQPYIYREYRQNELVTINDYQNAETIELLRLWILLNRQIIRVIQNQTEQRLDLKVQLTDGDPSVSEPAEQITDLRFLITDYPEHMEHHIKQITGL
jgi:uncharacterized damage-inducible protein DinB